MVRHVLFRIKNHLVITLLSFERHAPRTVCPISSSITFFALTDFFLLAFSKFELFKVNVQDALLLLKLVLFAHVIVTYDPITQVTSLYAFRLLHHDPAVNLRVIHCLLEKPCGGYTKLVISFEALERSLDFEDKEFT